MDFELSASSACSATPCAPSWTRDPAGGAGVGGLGPLPDEIVAAMAEMGLFGLTVPEEYGGLGADMVSFAIVFEEISRGWMGVAGIIGSHSLSCWMIARYGTEEQRTRYLPRPGDRRPPDRHRADRAGAGSDLQGIAPPPAATATTMSSTAGRPGSPTPGTPTRCRCWSRPTRRPAGPRRHVGAAGRGRDARLRGRPGPAQARLPRAGDLRAGARRRPGAGQRAARRRRGPRPAAGAGRAGDRPDQRRRPGRGRRPGGLRPGAGLRRAAARRSASRSLASRPSS